MKQFYSLLISAVFILLNSANLKAQSIEERFQSSFNSYCNNLVKKPEKASESLKEASELAYKSYNLNSDLKILTWYLYLGDLIKNNPQSPDVKTYSLYLSARGPKEQEKIKSYGFTLITANAHIIYAQFRKPEWKGISLCQAKLLLERLEKEQPVAEKDFEPFYALSGLDISEKERLNMLDYVEQLLQDYNSKGWYDIANTAYTESDMDGNKSTARMAVIKAEEKAYPDSWALHARMIEDGEIFKRDLNQVAELYRKSAEAGGKWGKVGYSRLLIESKVVQQDYNTAFNLLSSIENDSEFGWIGGAYELARLYENGWGTKKNYEKATALYMQSNEKAYKNSIRKKSYEAANRIENRIMEELIDQDVKEMNIKNMNTQELTTLAQRYEGAKAQEKAFQYHYLAAEKGSSYSACKLGLEYFNRKELNSKNYEKAAKMFTLGAEGNYAPCKYNIAVMLIYGFGVSPNHDKAKEYYQRYISQITAEGYGEYYKSDYIGTITGYAYYDEPTKKGIPLQKALADYEDPEKLYSYGRARERDDKIEIAQYFYQRAAAKGHKKASERLEVLKTTNK